MKISRSQYDVNYKNYLFKKTKENGKITGRFVVAEFGLVPFSDAVYLEYLAYSGEGGKRDFCMDLWNGNNFFADHIKNEKGTLSKFNKKFNKDYEEKVKNMIIEALKLSEEKITSFS